jgi:ribonuclease-3
MWDGLPEELARQAVTHASWVEQRGDSYERLAFLGDSVLALAVTTHLFGRLDADGGRARSSAGAEGGPGAGQLTKIRAQAVSRRSNRAVAERLGLPDRLRQAAPPDQSGPAADQLAQTDNVLAEMSEAVIGACYVHYGFEQTAEAVVEAFAPEIEESFHNPADFKSELQERLARRGATVTYVVTEESGPPHARTFEVAAMVGGAEVARGTGRSKKDAEQAAAEAALDAPR